MNTMNNVKNKLLKFFFATLALVAPALSFAQLTNPIKSKTIAELVQAILAGVVKIGMPIITLAIIYCGFLFVQARGKPEKITKAREALLYTLIGAAILLGSWTIAQLITGTVEAL